jgi:hypothetical protein
LLYNNRVRYQVPQYLEVEDRIFGPLTLKQFLFAAGGAGGAYAFWSLLPNPINIIGAILVVAAAGALGFGQMNGRPFLVMIESMVTYGLSRKLYLWRKRPKAPVAQGASEKEAPAGIAVPRLSDSKLKDLAWGLDLQETLGRAEAPNEDRPGRPRKPTVPAGII